MENKDNMIILEYLMHLTKLNDKEFAVINDNFDKVANVVNKHTKTFKWIGIEFILFSIICYLQNKDIHKLNKRIAILEYKSKNIVFDKYFGKDDDKVVKMQ